MVASPALVADLSDAVPVARTLTAADIDGLVEAVAAYRASFASCFARRDQRAWVECFLRGLLTAAVPSRNMGLAPIVRTGGGEAIARAEQRQRSLDDEVVLTLASTGTVEADLPADLATTLAPMPALDDDTLWQMARSRVPEEDAARLAELGDKRQRVGLTAEEMREAEALVQRHDRILVVRAEAAALLKQRGFDIRHHAQPIVVSADQRG